MKLLMFWVSPWVGDTGHGALIDLWRDLAGKPSSKIRLSDGTLKDSRTVVPNKNRIQLNGLDRTTSDRAFLDCDAAPPLSLFPEGAPTSKKQATVPRQQVITPVENTFFSLVENMNDLSSVMNPPYEEEPVSLAVILLEQVTEHIFDDSNAMTTYNVDTGQEENEIQPIHWQRYMWLQSDQNRSTALRVINRMLDDEPDWNVDEFIRTIDKIRSCPRAPA
jgi:hypothetical protein